MYKKAIAIKVPYLQYIPLYEYASILGQNDLRQNEIPPRNLFGQVERLYL